MYKVLSHKTDLDKLLEPWNTDWISYLSKGGVDYNNLKNSCSQKIWGCYSHKTI